MTGRRIRVCRSVCVCVPHPSLFGRVCVTRVCRRVRRSSAVPTLVSAPPSASLRPSQSSIQATASQSIRLVTPREQQSQALIRSFRPSFRVTCSEPLFPSHLLRAARFKSFFSATLSESQLGVVTELLGGPDVLPSPLADRISALRARLAARLGEQGGGGGAR